MSFRQVMHTTRQICKFFGSNRRFRLLNRESSLGYGQINNPFSRNATNGKVTVHFKFPNGKIRTVEAKQGSNLLDVVIDHDVDIDGFGACEGTLACSTCHLILPESAYAKLAPPIDEELDMLDLAYELTDTSRLGCQVVLTKDLDGLEVTVPLGLADARG